MQHITKEHRSKLAVIFYLLSLACLIGLIAIFISFSLLFYRKWPFDTNKPCPESQTFKFVNKISILQIIYTVMLGLFTLCLLVLVIVLLKHKYNIQKYWHVSNKFRILYPLFIAIGLVAGIVALLLVIKFYARIQQVIYYYYDGALPVTCLTSSELNDINNKLTPLIILIVLISLMIFFTIWAFCLLPYRYFRQGQIQNYQEIVPLQNKVQDKLEVLHVPKLEISHQELLAAPVVSARNYVTTGIGDENVNVSENILPQVGQQLAKPELKNAGVGNHFEYKNQVTDCQGLIKQIQYKTQSVNTYQQIEKVANKKNVEQNGMFILKEPAKKPDQTVDKFVEVPVEKNLKLAAYRPQEIALKREIQMPAQKSILKPIQIPIKKQVQVLVQERHAELVLPKRIQSSSMQLLQKKPIQKQTKNSDAIQINKISLPESQIASSKLSIKNMYEIKIDKQGQPSKDKLQLNVTPSRLRNLQRTETRQVDPELLTPRNKGLQTKFMQVQVPEKVEGIEKPDTQNEVYYYNKSNSGSQVSIRSKGMRKVQKSHINSPSNHLHTEFSSRKLIQDDKPILRATKGLLGQNGIDWSHYNILWAGERINKIYTPPKTPKSQLRSSNKSSFQKWQQQSSKKQKI